MTAVAGTVQAFFTERLIGQRRASPHTVAAYRDAIRLLLNFAAERTGAVPRTGGPSRCLCMSRRRPSGEG